MDRILISVKPILLVISGFLVQGCDQVASRLREGVGPLNSASVAQSASPPTEGAINSNVPETGPQREEFQSPKAGNIAPSRLIPPKKVLSETSASRHDWEPVRATSYRYSTNDEDVIVWNAEPPSRSVSGAVSLPTVSSQRALSASHEPSKPEGIGLDVSILASNGVLTPSVVIHGRELVLEMQRDQSDFKTFISSK